MTDRYSQTIRISATEKNTVEQFINNIKKQSDEGRVRYGVQINVERVTVREGEVTFE